MKKTTGQTAVELIQKTYRGEMAVMEHEDEILPGVGVFSNTRVCFIDLTD